MKICKTCGIEKPTTHFYVKKKKPVVTYRSDCKICYGIKSAEAFRKPEATEARKKSWRKYSRFKLYGITEAIYDSMVANQSGCCKICGVEDDNLHIDHCHATGKVRGLLCQSCNTGLGKFKDDVVIMGKAIEYLCI